MTKWKITCFVLFELPYNILFRPKELKAQLQTKPFFFSFAIIEERLVNLCWVYIAVWVLAGGFTISSCPKPDIIGIENDGMGQRWQQKHIYLV